MEIEIPDDIGDRITKVVKTFLLQGKAAARKEVQRQLIPHILEIFAEYDEETVYKFIVTDYPLVEERTPDEIRNALRNMAKNDRLRPMYHQWMLNAVTPENILYWLRHPDEWLDEDEADEQRKSLRETAAIIEDTPGGYEWLEAQVWAIYAFAEVVPEDSTPQAATKGT